ncbi:putative ribonuclease H-like domain-containing protein [Tanacetum coccineum]
MMWKLVNTRWGESWEKRGRDLGRLGFIRVLAGKEVRDELRRKLDLAQKQKDEIQLTLENLENSSKNLSKLLDCQIVDKCKTGLGYNVIPPPYTGNVFPPTHDLSFSDLEEFVNEPIVSEPTVKKPVVEISEAKASADKPKVVRKNNGAPIIEDWVSDSEEDVPQAKKEKKTVKSSFAKIGLVKSKEQRLGSNFEMFKKACYVCGCFDHPQYDCNNHQRQFNNKKMVKPVWNYTQRVNHQNFSRMTHPVLKGTWFQKHILMRSGLVLLTTARQVSNAQPKTIVNSARPMTNIFNKAHSTVRRPINNKTTTKNSNFNKRVNTVSGKNVNTARPKVVVNAARPKVVLNVVKENQVNVIKASACWVWKPKTKVINRVSKHNSASTILKRFDYIDAQGSSKHMTGNMSYLTDFEEIDGGYVAFGGNPKGGKITGRGTIKTGNLDFENMYFDEASGILKSFITRVENLIDQRVKVIRCDNGIEFKNKDMNQVCERKGIKRKFSIAITPQQNRVVERKNRTLIEAARTMLADSKLPTTFWAEAFNTACYVQNKVLVTKPHNKTPYELFLGKKSALSFMRPFGCPVTILNTIDHLGKFDGKADEGFFVGYSINSKAFRVFNNRTRIVKENLHVQFSENTHNIVGSGPNWLFDIDALTESMNYKPVIAGNQSNGNAGIKACDDAGKIETVPGKDYILLPLWPADLLFSQCSKSSPNAGFKPLGYNEKKVTEELGKEGGDLSIKLPDDPNMPKLEDIVYSDDDEDVGTEADMNNLDAFMLVSPILTTRIHKDHRVEKLIRDLNSAPQTRRMTKNLEEHRRTQKGNSCIEGSKLDRGYAGGASIIQVAQGYTQEERIDYDEGFAPIARIEAIRLFLAYDSFKDFVVSQMDVKSVFLYGKIEEEVYDEDGEEVDVHLYRSMISSLMYLTSSGPDIMFAVCACARCQVNLKVSHLHAVKRIFRYLKGQPKLGLWYPKDSPFDLVAYTDSDYPGASLDRKSTT